MLVNKKNKKCISVDVILQYYAFKFFSTFWAYDFLWSSSEQVINGPVLALTLIPKVENLSYPVRITFRHFDVSTFSVKLLHDYL